jgi:hypothetical protein
MPVASQQSPVDGDVDGVGWSYHPRGRRNPLATLVEEDVRRIGQGLLRLVTCTDCRWAKVRAGGSYEYEAGRQDGRVEIASGG